MLKIKKIKASPSFKKKKINDVYSCQSIYNQLYFLDLFVYNCNTFIINQCSGFKRIKKMYRVN